MGKKNPVGFVSTKEAAELLGYSVLHLQRLCAAGKVPHLRRGRAYFFSQQHLAAALGADLPSATPSPFLTEPAPHDIPGALDILPSEVAVDETSGNGEADAATGEDNE